MRKKTLKNVTKRPKKSFKPENFNLPKPAYFKGDGHKEIGFEEPSWPPIEEQIAWTREEYENKLQEAFSWYNLTQDAKSSLEWGLTALNLTKQHNDLVTKLKKAPWVSTVGFLLRMAHMGMILHWHEKEFIAKKFRIAMTLISNETQSEEKAEPTINIQDRIRAKLSQVIGVFDAAFDDFLVKKTEPNFIKLLSDTAPPSNRVKDLILIIERKYLNELKEVQAGKNVDLNEAYNPYGKREIKKMVDFWNNAISAINSYSITKKINRKPRKRKEVSPTKVVSKLKYLKLSEKPKLASIDPTQILKSTELYVYNIKTRKLGLFICDNHASNLDVKGSKILNYDITNSVQKTLRNPEKQLAEFAILGKPAAKKWFKNIKSVEIKLRPGLNNETILLKASK